MPRAVKFDEYGDVDVLKVVEVDEPSPKADEVVVRVVAAGTNPGEVPIRSGAGKDRFPAHFPEGQGSDLAGVIASVGDSVTDVAVGDEVIGLSDARNAQADYALLPADRVVPKPEALDWAVAGSLFVVGTTAVAMMRSVHPDAGETVVVSGAAGGVGTLVTQLAVQTGARVIAVASEANHAVLRGWGAEPVEYGDGLEERIRELAPDGVDAMLDTHGDGYVDLAVALGVDPDRIDTIIDFEGGGRVGAHRDGMATVDDPAAVVSTLAEQLARGELELPIKAHYPLDSVADAYREVEKRSGLGKVVLEVSDGGAAG
ncbi:NADP-dependent oxidoreductase [Glaciibacter flavus]|uniref:NADP-dependent oxidoreductase n=1 Tax=Orlajensenia flava TaxID=2565934 RepID=A0A4S4FW38_9MICO|nr:NADP-dependent oxidoreductase [Glaciibacter flavus]THG34282.1 NADP-dependent oxidoreductase [Glaciibacter flavus]